VATLYPAPSEPAVEALLGGLIAASAQVRRAPASDPERDSTGIFAEFLTDDDRLAVLGFADPETINVVGGTMLGLETDALKEANEKRLVLDDSLEGFHEVVNVFSSCLNTRFTPHLRLGEVHNLPGQLSEDVKRLWRQPRGRRSYRVSVDDFGNGTLILYLG